MSTNNRPVWPWLVGGGLIFILGLILCCLLVGILFFTWNLMPMQRSSGPGGPGSRVTVQVIQETAVRIPTQAAQVTETPVITEPVQMPDTSATPLPGEFPRPALSTFDQEGVSFAYPWELASGIQVENVPASGGTDVPFPNPEYLHLVLSGYPLSDTFHEPQIFIYPANELASSSAPGAQILQDLQALLKDRPEDPDQLPFLPLWNAAQMMHAQLRYLDFENGSGVRYLSQYGQSFYPINNTDMIYTFQGLTSDGRFYVAFILPVSNPILPDPETIQMDDAFAENFPNYIQEIEDTLNQQPDSSFTPVLTRLDEMIQSLEITRPE